MASLLSNKI